MLHYLSIYILDLFLGIIDVHGLKRYLTENGYPMTVMLAEDGTRVTPRAQFDGRSNTITGLVSPLDTKGLPKRNYFDATNAQETADKLKHCPLASTAYVQLAIPLVPGAAPFMLFYMATDNSFKSSDVIKRWVHTIELLLKHGITVFGMASDGDPTLLKSMVSITNFDRVDELGNGFGMALHQIVYCFQDITHSLNKLRRKLFDRKRALLIGSKLATVAHLDDLVRIMIQFIM